MSPGPVLDPATLEELRRLARSRPRSGRQSAAKASAIRTLERLARERRRQPMPPMPDGWYPHEPGDPFYELDWLSCMRTPRSCGGIGSWRGARGECERARRYSRSPTAARASAWSLNSSDTYSHQLLLFVQGSSRDPLPGPALLSHDAGARNFNLTAAP
jgi:hypothetical protein